LYVLLLVVEEELVEELERVVGVGDGVANGAVVRVDLKVVAALVGLECEL
jgi:hypothetical protein